MKLTLLLLYLALAANTGPETAAETHTVPPHTVPPHDVDDVDDDETGPCEALCDDAAAWLGPSRRTRLTAECKADCHKTTDAHDMHDDSGPGPVVVDEDKNASKMGRPNTCEQRREQPVPHLNSADEVRATLRLPLAAQTPFTIDASLTRQWPILDELSTLEQIVAKYGAVDARLVNGLFHGEWIGNAGEGQVSIPVVNPLVASKYDLKQAERLFVEEGATLPTTTRWMPAKEAIEASKLAENRPAYIHFLLNHAQWAELRGLCGDGSSVGSGAGLFSLFDDATFLDCLGPDVEDMFNADFSWHQFVISQQGSGMWLHMDGDHSHFWALQLRGRKEWVFCPPAMGPELYMGSVNAFDHSEEARERYPRFEAARTGCYHVTTRPGEILSWQSHWWHTTNVPKNSSSQNEPSIAVMAAFIDRGILDSNRCLRDFMAERGAAQHRWTTATRDARGTGSEARDCAADCSACAVEPLDGGRAAGEGDDEGGGEGACVDASVPGCNCEESPAMCYVEKFEPEFSASFGPGSGSNASKDDRARLETCLRRWRQMRAGAPGR
jgi:hypothetical protein